MKSIVLMGIKHCGKSTQGKILAKKLELPFFDTDSLTEEMNGMTCRQIYSEKGEAAFKTAEYQACKKIKDDLASKKNKCAVIATGGGICNNPEAIALLKSIAEFIFLKTPEKLAADRIVKEAKTDSQGNLTNIPAYIAKKNPRTKNDIREIFHDFYTERVKIYEELADTTVQMTDDSVEQNSDRILCSI